MKLDSNIRIWSHLFSLQHQHEWFGTACEKFRICLSFIFIFFGFFADMIKYFVVVCQLNFRRKNILHILLLRQPFVKSLTRHISLVRLFFNRTVLLLLLLINLLIEYICLRHFESFIYPTDWLCCRDCFCRQTIARGITILC